MTALEETRKWLVSMHGFVIGPGLGRADYLGWFLKNLVESMNENQIVIIIDADGLWAFINNELLFNIVKKRKGVFLTPNVGEFERLWRKVMGDTTERYNLIIICCLFFMKFYYFLAYFMIFY